MVEERKRKEVRREKDVVCVDDIWEVGGGECFSKFRDHE